jgi:ATP-binding cassette subfamily F protein 2
VAEELWEVKDKTIKNLSKDDISIVDYKKILVKHSEYHFSLFNPGATSYQLLTCDLLPGVAAIEKAKLFSKSAPKGRT